MAQHRHALDPHPESQAGVFALGITAKFEHLRIHHAAAHDLQPFFLSAFPGNVDFRGGLGEREKVRTESHFNILAEKFLAKMDQQSLKIGKLDVLVDQKALDLMKYK